MGDTACLMQPFCYASGIPNEGNQSNPIHALGQSISFGRFMSESVAWEKWSTCSHNRYVEEAERFSRPGSVAQKKAFFEAHYKKLAAQKAAALLQQANNAASNDVTQQPHDSLVDNNHIEEKQDFKVLNSQPHARSSNVSEINKLKEADPETQHQPYAGNSVKVKLQSKLEDDGDTRMRSPILKSSNSNKENLASVSKNKPPVSSKFTSTPVKPRVSDSSKKDNFATPTSKRPALSSSDKKRSPPKSLHVSHFTPIKELNRLTASVMNKFGSARVGAASSKALKDSNSTPLRTPTMDSKNECQNHSSMTPLTEKIRTKTPITIDSTASGGKKCGTKWRLLSAEKKLRSPVISSPFSLRTEERAARRKKKLEEKFNANEAQVQLHTRLKKKAETEIRKLRESFCFKARPLPDFYKERKALKEERTTGPGTHPESPKQGRKAIPNMVESKTPLPPHRPSSVKNNGINGRTSTHPLTSNSIMNNMRIRQIFSMRTKMTDITK